MGVPERTGRQKELRTFTERYGLKRDNREVHTLYLQRILYGFYSISELREAFEAEAQEVKKPRLMLTAAVPVGPDNIKGGYDVPAVSS